MIGNMRNHSPAGPYEAFPEDNMIGNMRTHSPAGPYEAFPTHDLHLPLSVEKL